MKIDCVKYRFASAGFAAILIAVTAGAYLYHGGFNYSIDFTGGTQVLLKFKNPITGEAVKDALSAQAWKGINTRSFSPDEVQVRVQEHTDDPQGVGQKIATELSSIMPNNPVSIQSTDSVSRTIGKYLQWNSIKAIAIALLLMLIYIAIRFQFAFAIGAVVALIHDALIIAAYFLLTNSEISVDVIGAVLLTLGYSVNDTIVIFTRVRENLKKMSGVSIQDIVNISLNQTMRRTMLTSFSTALVVISLIVLGGEMLRGLSITLLLGIIFGTYSSVFVASPVMLLFYKKQDAQ
jgi:preprotein translocase subunit SecF